MSVRQVNNMLALLEFFAAYKKSATLADIVEHFGWPRSSAFNIITTLLEAGYLYEPKAREGYFPTPRWAQIVGSFAEAEPVPQALVNIMHRLAEATGETICISAPSGQFAVFLNTLESTKAIRYAAPTGKRIPIHITATGQALLSSMSQHDQDIILRRAKYGCWGVNAAPDIDTVRQQLACGKERGWYQSASNFSPDLGGVAVPVVVNERVFSVTVAGPLFRVEDKIQEHATLLKRTIASELERAASTEKYETPVNRFGFSKARTQT